MEKTWLKDNKSLKFTILEYIYTRSQVHATSFWNGFAGACDTDFDFIKKPSFVCALMYNSPVPCGTFIRFIIARWYFHIYTQQRIITIYKGSLNN